MSKTSTRLSPESKYSFDRALIATEELDRVALKLGGYLDAARLAKGQLPQRWQANEDCYHCNQTTSVEIASENAGQEELPIWQTKCDRISGDVHRQMTATYPIVQCIDESADARPTADIENALTILSDRAGYITDHLRDVVDDSLNTNNGWLRTRPLVDDESGKVVGFDQDTIHPRNVFVHPAEVTHVSKSLMVAHAFNLMQWELQERIDQGIYLDPGVQIVGGDEYIGSNDRDDTVNIDDDQMLQPTQPTGKEDTNIVLYEVLVRLKLDGDTKYLWYICVLWKDGAKLLDIQQYGAKRGSQFIPYPEPWYVKYYVKRSRGNIWSPWAPANSMQSIQGDISALKELAIQGTEFGALPTVFIEGPGSLQAKSYTYKAGTVWELAAGQTMKKLDMSFNPGMLEPMIEFLGTVADGATGVSRLGTSENLPASTSATAAAGFLQAQSEAKSDYASMISDGVESTWRVMFWILQIHADTILQANKGKLPAELTVETIRGLSLRFEATGTSGASNPQVYIQKLMMLKQITANDPVYDQNKINQKIIELMDLPIELEAFMSQGLLLHPKEVALMMGPPYWYTPQEIAQELASKMQQRDAMGHVQAALSQLPPVQQQQLLAAQQMREQQNQNGQQPQQAPTVQPGQSQGLESAPGASTPPMGTQGSALQMSGNPGQSSGA